MIIIVKGNMGDLILLYLLLSEAKIHAVVIEVTDATYKTAYHNVASLFACMGKEVPIFSNFVNTINNEPESLESYLSSYIIGTHEYGIRDYRKMEFLMPGDQYTIVSANCDNTLNSSIIQDLAGNIYSLSSIEDYNISTQFEARSILVVNKFLHYMIPSLDVLNTLTNYPALAFHLLNKGINT